MTGSSIQEFFLQKMPGLGRSRDTAQKVAEYLKINPQKIDEFERKYRDLAIDQKTDETNAFEYNSREASAAIRNQTSESSPDEIIGRIAKNLSLRTFAIKIDKPDFFNVTLPLIGYLKSVTNEDLKAIPAASRPLLTDKLMKVDIDSMSSTMLMYQWAKYLQESDPQKKHNWYHLFRQGLDILDMDHILYSMLRANPNSMGHWLLALSKANDKCGFFKIPNTIIANVPMPILQLSRLDYGSLNRTTLDIVDRWAMDVFDLDVSKSYFIKTGTYSSKFDFRNAKVTGEKEVRELGEYLLFIQHQASMMASPLSNPCIYGVSTTNEWVVREFIEDKENNPTIYKGLPLHTEYRFFLDFDTDEILGVSPYWRSDVMKKRFAEGADRSVHDFHDYVIYQAHEDTLMSRYRQNIDKLSAEVRRLVPYVHLTGQWSLDIMQNGDDFWLIDMATADTSALSDCVPVGKIVPRLVNWIGNALPLLQGEKGV